MPISAKAKPQTLIIIKEIYDLIEKGWTTGTIIHLIKSKYNIKEKTINTHMAQAYEIIDKNAEKDLVIVTRLHCDRYEEIYQENKVQKLEDYNDDPDEEEEEDDEGYDYRDKKRSSKREMLKKLNEAMNALQDKERLLGFHKKTFNIQINNNKKIEKKSIIDKYDLSQLTLSEKIELKNLLEKSKIDYIQKVVRDTEVKIIDTVKDLRDKYYVPEVISQIQEEKNPEEEEAETINQIIDLVPKDIEQKSSINVGENLKNLIKKQAEEILRRRNKKQ